MVGPVLGGRQGALVGQPVWPGPHNVTSWRVFDEADGRYVDDMSTAVTCSCPGLYSRYLMSFILGYTNRGAFCVVVFFF